MSILTFSGSRSLSLETSSSDSLITLGFRFLILSRVTGGGGGGSGDPACGHEHWRGATVVPSSSRMRSDLKKSGQLFDFFFFGTFFSMDLPRKGLDSALKSRYCLVFSSTRLSKEKKKKHQ